MAPRKAVPKKAAPKKLTFPNRFTKKKTTTKKKGK